MKSKDYLKVFNGVRLGIDTIVNSLSIIDDGTSDDLVKLVLELEQTLGNELGCRFLTDMKVGDFKEVDG